MQTNITTAAPSAWAIQTELLCEMKRIEKLKRKQNEAKTTTKTTATTTTTVGNEKTQPNARNRKRKWKKNKRKENEAKKERKKEKWNEQRQPRRNNMFESLLFCVMLHLNNNEMRFAERKWSGLLILLPWLHRVSHYSRNIIIIIAVWYCTKMVALALPWPNRQTHIQRTADSAQVRRRSLKRCE